MPAWPLALVCLPAGFAVAELTGSRPAGGVVLVLIGAGTVAVSFAPLPRRLAWGLIAFVCFVLSHVLGRGIGSWPAVAVAAAVTGAAGLVLLDRAPRA